MVRKFGSKQAGTGSVSEGDAVSGTDKWSSAAKTQLDTAGSVKSILAKTIPVDYIKTDPNNPRKLAITKAQVEDIATSFPLNVDALSAENPDDYLSTYIDTINQESGLSGKALVDMISIIEFAAALKSPSRLLNPITVSQKESEFTLIAGERRLFAHVFLRAKTIAAKIEQAELSRADIDALQWEENVHRVDMSLWEKVSRVQRLIEGAGGLHATSVTKVSKLIGKSRAEAQRYFAVLRYPDPILMQALETGKISDLKKAAAYAQLNVSDLKKVLEGNSLTKSTAKPTIKFSKDANTQSLAKVLLAAAQQLGAKDLLDEFNLTKPNQLAAALEALAEVAGRN